MIDLEAQRLREEYLGRLDTAIADLPWRVANELRSGIVEELDDLDADAMRERIAQLGEPERIAGAAREEAGPVPPVIVVAPAPGRLPAVDTRWFAVVGGLVLGFGGFLLPIAGWVIGVALVTSSRFWRRWEKAVAILLPFAMAGLVFVVSAVVRLIWAQAPADGVGNNPLLPGVYDVGILVVAYLLVPVGALWLLWRLRGRDAPRR